VHRKPSQAFREFAEVVGRRIAEKWQSDHGDDRSAGAVPKDDISADP